MRDENEFLSPYGESGRGLGASHPTGWAALVIRLLETAAQRASS